MAICYKALLGQKIVDMLYDNVQITLLDKM